MKLVFSTNSFTDCCSTFSSWSALPICVRLLQSLCRSEKNGEFVCGAWRVTRQSGLLQIHLDFGGTILSDTILLYWGITEGHHNQSHIRNNFVLFAAAITHTASVSGLFLVMLYVPVEMKIILMSVDVRVWVLLVPGVIFISFAVWISWNLWDGFHSASFLFWVPKGNARKC